MRKADNLTTILCRCHEIWSLNFLEPSGKLQACNGTALPFTTTTTTTTKTNNNDNNNTNSSCCYYTHVFSLHLLTTKEHVEFGLDKGALKLVFVLAFRFYTVSKTQSSYSSIVIFPPSNFDATKFSI